MTSEPATYPGYRFPAEIISHAIWLYHLFGLSFRDVELILAERSIVVSHESIRQWCLKFGGEFARRLRRRRPKPGDTWHLDEVFLRALCGRPGGCNAYLPPFTPTTPLPEAGVMTSRPATVIAMRIRCASCLLARLGLSKTSPDIVLAQHGRA
jgi:putative transposase